MTHEEYTARREALLRQLSSPHAISKGDGSAVTHRSPLDIQRALAALDAEWQRQAAPSVPRIGRLYISGEGR